MKNSIENTMEKWFSLANVTCVVAGCEGLIGKSSTNALLDCGATVYGLDCVPETKNSKHDNFHFHTTDITKEDELKKFFSQLSLKKNQDQECFFINASYPRTENWPTLDFLNVDKSDWNKNVELHLGSAFHFSQLAIDFLKKNGLSGGLLNFASIYALHGPDLSIYTGTSMKNPSPYAAIKAGIIGLTKHIATSFGEHNIRANIIAPGGVLNKQAESFIKNYSRKTPMGRLAQPNDIAGVVAFLAAPAARYINGQTIYVDGGWTSW